MIRGCRGTRTLRNLIGFGVAVVALVASTAPAAFGAVTMNKTEQRLTTSVGDEYDPAVSGDLVSYTTNRNGNTDVCVFDIATSVEIQATSGFNNHELSDVSGGRVAYTDLSIADVMVFDVAARTTVGLTADSPFAINPAISGDIVAWEDRRDGNYEIYAKDLSTGEVRRVTDSPLFRDMRPAVSGTRIVWEKCNTVTCDIWSYDWTTGATQRITSTPGAEHLADVSGDVVVYEGDQGSATGPDICAFDLSTGVERVLALPGVQTNANVSGQCVTFEEVDVSGVYHIKLWYLPTDQVFDLTTGSSGQYLNDIDMIDPMNGRVVYTDDRGGQLDIYMTTFELVDQAKPDVSVSPPTVLFGDVEVGKSTSTLVTVQNTGDAPLVFTCFLNPATENSLSLGLTAATVAPGASVDIPITFAPTSARSIVPTAELIIQANVVGKESLRVPISGNGVVLEIPPSQQAADLLAFYNASLGDGSLYGLGPGKSAGNRTKALGNMIEAAGDLIARGKLADAKSQLNDVLAKWDGLETPPDFVAGTPRAELATRVRALIAKL